MIQLALNRIVQLGLVLLAVTLLVFVLMVSSGDAAALMAGESATIAEIDDLRARLGFDRPWYEQYARYMQRVIQGDLGRSVRQQRDVTAIVLERFPATLQLSGLAFLVSIAVALPVGIVSAVKRNSIFDRIAMGAAVLAQAVPVFWLGIVLILIFSVWLGVTPVGGRTGGRAIILPVVTLSTIYVARNARLIRSSLLEVMSLDFVRTARAKGLPESRVLMVHAFRNSLIPVMTVVGLQFGGLLSGAVVTELVFAWPGVGRLLVQAVLGRDTPLVLGATIMIAAFIVLVNFATDMLYGVVDPRVRKAT